MTESLGIGAALKQAREQQGLAIDDVAQQLKFAPRQIESLEHERFERLPGPTIARGMVRNYARLLKLDPEPLLERMGAREAAAPQPAKRESALRPPVPFSDGARRSTIVYAGFSIGLLVLVGAVAYEWQQEKATPQFVAPAQPQRPEPVQPVAAAAPAQPAPLEEKHVEPAPPMVVTLDKTAVEKPLPPGMHRVVLRVTAEEAWLEVRDNAGRSLISSLNPAGTERSVRGRAPLELVIGNPEHVTLTHNGKPVDLTPYTKVGVARLTLQ